MHAAVFYATRYGHALRVAERIAGDLRGHGFEVDLRDAKAPPETIVWTRYASVCLVGSVHYGVHEPEIVAFAARHRTELTRLHASFVSVSGSEAGAEDATATPERRRKASGDVQRMIDRFITDTGWTPAHVLPVAGEIAYRRYNVLMRFMLKQQMRIGGGPTDTSRNHVFTNWSAVDEFVDRVLETEKV
jgi:menaquinone-dependent protoporphyrinogen oxidase